MVHHIVSTNIALYFLESDPFQVFLSKNQFPGSREFTGNIICIPDFTEMTKCLSRGNTSCVICESDCIFFAQSLLQAASHDQKEQGMILLTPVDYQL
jgi:hypothetical protein